MVNYPNYLSGSQDDINKRLLQMILKLEKGENGETEDISALEEDVSDLKTAIGDESTANSILGRIKALEDAS